MLTADTSVVLPSLVPMLEPHVRARALLDGAIDDLALVDHVLLESYSVLTRLPGLRLPAGVAHDVLSTAFPAPALSLPPGARGRLVQRLAAAGVVGGAVYDGLIALTAVHHDATLLTLDRRAARTYAALGVPTRGV